VLPQHHEGSRRRQSLGSLTALLSLVALTGGCQARWPWQSAPYPRNPQALAQCQRERAAALESQRVRQQWQGQLKQLKAETFIPPAKPTPIDPELAQRYTQEDRDLDEERYQRSLRDWEQLHAERYRLWLADHTQRERALELKLQRQPAKAPQACNPQAF
jgi:hypothetical protein